LPDAGSAQIVQVYGFPNGEVWFVGGWTDPISGDWVDGIALRYKRDP